MTTACCPRCLSAPASWSGRALQSSVPAACVATAAGGRHATWTSSPGRATGTSWPSREPSTSHPTWPRTPGRPASRPMPAWRRSFPAWQTCARLPSTPIRPCPRARRAASGAHGWPSLRRSREPQPPSGWSPHSNSAWRRGWPASTSWRRPPPASPLSHRAMRTPRLRPPAPTPGALRSWSHTRRSRRHLASRGYASTA